MNLSGARKKFTGAAFGQAGGTGITFNLYNASVKVSYLLDIFGGVTRELEALQSQVDYQRYQLERTYLTLTANVVTTVVQEASLRARLEATREILSEEEKQYTVVQTQFQLGALPVPMCSPSTLNSHKRGQPCPPWKRSCLRRAICWPCFWEGFPMMQMSCRF